MNKWITKEWEAAVEGVAAKLRAKSPNAHRLEIQRRAVAEASAKYPNLHGLYLREFNGEVFPEPTPKPTPKPAPEPAPEPAPARSTSALAAPAPVRTSAAPIAATKSPRRGVHAAIEGLRRLGRHGAARNLEAQLADNGERGRVKATVTA